MNVAVIKHDGHDFEADVPETDSWNFAKAGADGTLVFSKTKYMMIHYDTVLPEEDLLASFPRADIILLEGFKIFKLLKNRTHTKRQLGKICV